MHIIILILLHLKFIIITKILVLRRRGDRSTLNFFRLDFLFVARFFPAVPDRVSKSKFLFSFSFSSHERLPWFKHVWDAP